MKPPLIILDANNLLHRFFHGRPTEIGREGKNVNAIRGLAALVGRLWRLFSPQAIVAAFDAGDSGRSRIFPAYKAHREGTPPELHYQFDLARRYLPSHYQTDVVCADGYEADDVIVTLAGVATTEGVEVVIVTNDKDLTCIVRDDSPRVTLYSVGAAGWAQIDVAAVRDRLGVPPAAVIDYLALCGDTSDGVPGVSGIGPKTAAELLGKFGDLDTLLAALDDVDVLTRLQVRPRWRDLLMSGREQALLARKVMSPVRVPAPAIKAGMVMARRPAP